MAALLSAIVLVIGAWASPPTTHSPPSAEHADRANAQVDELLRRADSASVARDTAEVSRSLARALLVSESMGADRPQTASVLERLCAYHRSRGDFRTAASDCERAVRIRERAGKAGSTDLAVGLVNWGAVLGDVGQLKSAREALERALQIRRTISSSDDVETARALYEYANVLRRLGDFDAADSLGRQAHTAQERLLGPDDPSTVVTELLLAMVASGRGDLAAARAGFERGLPILERAWGPNNQRVGRYYISLGNLLDDLGEFDGARLCYDRALASLEASLGPDHPILALGLLNYGMFKERIGDRRGAKKLLERAATIQENKLGPENIELAYTLHNLSVTLDNLHEWDTAKRVAERSLAIERKTFGPNHPRVLVTEASLGNILTNMGDLVAARTLLEHVVSVNEKSMEDSDPTKAVQIEALAWNLLASGEFTAAERLMRRALSIKESALGPDNGLLAIELGDLSVQRLMVGDDRGAVDAALRGETITRNTFRLTARRMSEREALESLQSRISGLGVALTVATHDSSADLIRRSWDAVIRSRSMLLDELAIRHRAIAAAKDTVTAQLLAEWERAREEIARLVEQGPGGDSLAPYRRNLMAAQERLEKQEDLLAARSAEFRRERIDGQAGFEDVSRCLDKSDALVAFVRYWDLSPIRGIDSSRVQTLGDPERAGHSAYLGFVLRGGESAPTIVPLGPAANIDDLVSRWLRATSRPPLAARQGGLDSSYIRLSLSTARAVWRPIDRYLSGAQRIFIVPDGTLNLVNFGALRGEDGRFLLEQNPLLQLVSTERDLVRYHESSSRGAGMLAVGAPDFDWMPPADSTRAARTASPEDAQTASGTFRGRRSSCGAFRDIHFASLPETGREVVEVAKLWDQSPKGHDARSRRQLGREATESSFKRDAPGKRVLHLATHGFFLGACTATKAEATPVDPADDDDSQAEDNPLLLSGLALAGANQRDQSRPGQDDGILSAEEIAAMDLSAVDVVVLSACETGLGAILPGEGVFGLRRAIQIAGAGTAIVSLWQVEDATTRRWMNALYQAHLVRGLGTAEASRFASLEILRQGRAHGREHPFYWAAFVPVGDWR